MRSALPDQSGTELGGSIPPASLHELPQLLVAQSPIRKLAGGIEQLLQDRDGLWRSIPELPPSLWGP
jgi:hypothetical protein